MKCGSRSCRVMLNYRLISVSAKTLYVFIRNHVESFNVIYEPCHGETCLCQYVAWRVGSSDPAGAYAVFGYHQGRGTWFFQDRAHMLVYMESYCISVVCKL